MEILMRTPCSPLQQCIKQDSRHSVMMKKAKKQMTRISLAAMEDLTLWRYRTLMTMRKGSLRMSSGAYRKETPSISCQSYA